MKTLRKLVRRYRDDDDGSTTVEFVIIFPVLIALTLSIFESGWLMTRSMMLERGLDIAVRDIRLGTYTELTHDQFKGIVCGYAQILSDCEANMVIEVVELDLTSAYPNDQATCVDRTSEIEPTIRFSPGDRNLIMFVRACSVIDPIMPGIGLGLNLPKDESGGFQLVSYSAFMNEPT